VEASIVTQSNSKPYPMSLNMNFLLHQLKC